jgi:hypothetical protein
MGRVFRGVRDPGTKLLSGLDDYDRERLGCASDEMERDCDSACTAADYHYRRSGRPISDQGRFERFLDSCFVQDLPHILIIIQVI